MTVRHLLLVALFGAFGAAARYALGRAIVQWMGEGFAYATLGVNVLGCFLLAMLFHVSTVTMLFSEDLRLGLTVGLLGAFTTFSTFGFETMQYAEEGLWLLAVINVAANVALGLAAVWAGLAVARLMFGGA
jgi:CrcB protein